MKVIYNRIDNCSEKEQLYYCSHVPLSMEPYHRGMHMHEDFSEIIMIVSGEGEYQIDGQKHNIKTGDMIILNSYVSHEEHLLACDSLGVETYCCGIKKASFNKKSPNRIIPDNASPVFSLGKYSDIVTHYMALIFSFLQDQQCVRAQSIFENFFSFLEETIFNHIQCYSEQNNDILLLRVKDYIERNYFENHTMKSLAELVNISPYYLGHKFKEKFNYSPINYLIKCRIGEAQTLLQNTDKQISDICFLVGFNNPSHFQSTFKQLVGVTPRSYRLDYRKENQIYN